MTSPRIYLDNAATSFPKPEQVYAAVEQYQRELGVAVGRGSSRAALEVQRRVEQCRGTAARLLGARSPAEVLFYFNGTDALNAVLHGWLRPGDRVITSPWEHNSVLRPLATLARRGVETTFLSPTADGRIDVAELEQLLRQQPTRLVVLSHASNVTGVVQPIAAATAAAQAAGARILIDAAQTAGHLPLSFDELGIDFLACSGHKGLLGPLGTGLLLVRAELQLELQPYRQGGTGTQSELEDLASGGPDRFEAGNHNAPGLFGLAAALEWLEHQTITGRHAAEQEMLGLLLTGLASLPGIELYPGPEPTASAGRIGVISLRLERLAPQILATLLDEHFGIEARAGLHCAPRAHLALGTLQGGGTLRLSPGAFTTVDEIDETLQALGQIALSV